MPKIFPKQPLDDADIDKLGKVFDVKKGCEIHVLLRTDDDDIIESTILSDEGLVRVEADKKELNVWILRTSHRHV